MMALNSGSAAFPSSARWAVSLGSPPPASPVRLLAAVSVAVLLAIAVISAVGCGSHDSSSPTASISGGGAEEVAASTAASPKAPLDRSHPVVQFHTSLGDITLRLDAEHAPITVDNFLTYLDKGQYDNTLFHQIMPGMAILGGGYDTFCHEKPTGQPIRNEAHNGLKNRRGTIAMARRPDAVDSSTCQFFINLADNPALDYQAPVTKVVDFRSVQGPREFKIPDASQYGYCVFGEVTSGMEVVDQIGKSALHDTDTLHSTPVEPVVLKWAHLMR